MESQLSDLSPIIGAVLALLVVLVQFLFKDREFLRWFLTSLGILMILIVFVLLVN